MSIWQFLIQGDYFDFLIILDVLPHYQIVDSHLVAEIGKLVVKAGKKGPPVRPVFFSGLKPVVGTIDPLALIIEHSHGGRKGSVFIVKPIFNKRYPISSYPSKLIYFYYEIMNEIFP